MANHMTDFSFQNRGYDLIQTILSERESVPEEVSDKDLRLLLDITKEVNPMFADADEDILVDLIADTLRVKVNKEELSRINRIEDDLYRPVHISEIKPGVTFRILGKSYRNKDTELQEIVEFYYNYTFPVKEMNLLEYNRVFMYIWERVKKGEVWIKNKFQHRIGDKVYHVIDKNSRGMIVDRKMTVTGEDNEYTLRYINEYTVFWGYVSDNSDITFKYWEKENDLINKTLLEALPMKTEINKTKRKKYIGVVGFKVDKRREEEDGQVRGSLEYVEERVIIPSRCRNFREYVLNLYDKRIMNGEIQFYKFLKVEPYNPINPIIKKPVRKIPHLNPVKVPQKHKKLGDRKREKRGLPESGYLVCVKYTHHAPNEVNPNIEVVSRIKKADAEKLVKRENGHYAYCTKQEWRAYLRKVAENREKNNPKPGLNESKKEFNRKTRRIVLQKQHKGSRLVKEQFVQKIVPGEKTTIFKRIFTRITSAKPIKITPEVKQERKDQSNLDKNKYFKKSDLKPLSELKKMFENDERRNGHYSSNEKWSESFDRLFMLATTGRLVYSERDIDIHLKKKDVYKWIRLIIKDEHHFKWSEEKIDDFIRYLRLTNRGVFAEIKAKTPRLTGKRKDTVDKNGIIKSKGKQYKKLSRVKKLITAKIFKAVKFVTRLDNTKLRYNVPDQDKPIVIKFNDDMGELEKEVVFRDDNMWEGDNLMCTLREVISWKYPDEKDFKNLITDTGGGIKEIPIKFKTEIPESLKKFFNKNKLKKLPFK